MHENPPNRALLKSGQQDKEEKPNSSSSSLTVEQQFYGASIENSSSNNDTLIDSIVQSAHAYTVQSQPSALYSTRYNSNQNERRGSDSSSVSAGDTSLTPLTLPRDASNEVVHTGDVFNIIDETDKTIGNGVNPSVGTVVSSKSVSKQSPLHIYAFEKPLCSNSKFKDNYFVLTPTVATNNSTKSPPSSSNQTTYIHANTSRSSTTNKRQSVAMYGKTTKQKAVSPNSPISQQHVAKKIKMDRQDIELPSTNAHLHQEHATSPLQNPSREVSPLDFLNGNPPEGTLPSGNPHVQQPTNTQLTKSYPSIQDSTLDRALVFTLPDRQQRMFDQNNHAQSSSRVGDQFLPQLPQVEDNSYLLILLNNYCEHLTARAVQNQQETTTQLISAGVQPEYFPVPTYPQQSEQSPSVNLQGMMQDVLASAIGFEQQQCLSSISALLDISIPQNIQIIPPILPNVPNFNQQQPHQQHIPQQIFPTFPQPFESFEDSQQRELLKLLYQLHQSEDLKR